MRVVKVLNNSLILALNDEGQEIILMGKGIGYNKSIGAHLDKKDIEKVFILKDREISKNMMRLVVDTDSIYFEIAKMVIDYALDTYQMGLVDHIYLALTDHLAFAAQRMKNGIQFQNFYTLDMKRFNPNEFDVGEYALKLMKEKADVDLPQDEVGNIAFHFITAQQHNPYSGKMTLINEVVADILDIVKYNFRLIYDEDSIAYSRFVTHLRLFVQRLISDKLLPQEKQELLFEQIISSLKVEHECVKKIEIYLKGRFKMTLTNQEIMYLTIHIHRILEERGENSENIGN